MGGVCVGSGTAALTGSSLLSQVPDLVVHEEEVYEDEDDENDEANWRNDYPDEESDTDEDREERYGGGFVLSSASIILAAKIKPNPVSKRPFLPVCRLLGGGALVQPGELAALPEGAVARAQLPRRRRRGRMPVRFRLTSAAPPAGTRKFTEKIPPTWTDTNTQLLQQQVRKAGICMLVFDMKPPVTLSTTF